LRGIFRWRLCWFVRWSWEFKSHLLPSRIRLLCIIKRERLDLIKLISHFMGLLLFLIIRIMIYWLHLKNSVIFIIFVLWELLRMLVGI
jgi:hypothetical protein